MDVLRDLAVFIAFVAGIFLIAYSVSGGSECNHPPTVAVQPAPHQPTPITKPAFAEARTCIMVKMSASPVSHICFYTCTGWGGRARTSYAFPVPCEWGGKPIRLEVL